MKFCNKLPKLRKEKNYSQEQLAEKLNVSRQAISKWESGSSYPDMEKMIEICKIFDCTLDQLMDDGVISKNKETVENKNILDDFLKTITKIYNMFIAMAFKQKVKCILEMIIIILIVVSIINISYMIIDDLILDLIKNITFNTLATLLGNLILIILYTIGIIIIYHLFKVRYLNYYITIEDKTVTKKIIEKEIDPIIVNKPKEKVIIRDQQHSTNNFIKIINKIFTTTISFFSIIMLIPMIITLILTIAGLIFLIMFISTHIIFLYISIIVLGLSLGLILLVYILVKLTFNDKLKFNIIFILFLISTFLMGLGTGLTVHSFTQMSSISYFDTITTNYEYELEVNEERLIHLINQNNTTYKDTNYNIGNTNINLIFNNELKNPKIKINTQVEKSIENFYLYHIFPSYDNYKLYFDTFINNLKNNQITTYNIYDEKIEIYIYISEQNYDDLYYKDY